MKIVYGLPTGGRPQAVDVVKQWKNKGADIAVITWDYKIGEWLSGHCGYLVSIPKIETWPKNCNCLAKIAFNYLNADLFICGADDLWPGNFNKDVICRYAKKYDDKIIYVHDGCNSRVCTHPIITKQWWLNHNKIIFDENYGHGFCDVDLTLMCVKDKSIIKCFDIRLDHRHPSQGKAIVDDIYKRGRELTAKGRLYFESKFGQIDIDKEVAGIERGSL